MSSWLLFLLVASTIPPIGGGRKKKLKSRPLQIYHGTIRSSLVLEEGKVKVKIECSPYTPAYIKMVKVDSGLTSTPNPEDKKRKLTAQHTEHPVNMGKGGLRG